MAEKRDVKGNTLRVYLHLLRHGPCGLREVQHELGLSTASLASYHLERLVDAGYAQKDEQGNYVTTKESPGQILAGYSKVGTALVPQFFFFAVLFTILVPFFAYASLQSPGFTPYLVATSAAMAGVIWFETARLWRRLVS
jgi:hypothetical protein